MKNLKLYEDFDPLNEGSYEDFLTNNADEIKQAIEELKQASEKLKDLSPEEYEKIVKAAFAPHEDTYDRTITEFVDLSLGNPHGVDARDIADTAMRNENQTGTEAIMILDAISTITSSIIHPRTGTGRPNRPRRRPE